eukprot:CAMPEP_0183307240 /NCGR_PEP_ID=MMETSP0160_2-20130417/17203_1 /TAXON_ID=2839 ORGANISM="Odontella Sinensis, Strain Grunow 1884" /NCGR_SAMPLE_ID=MMETSP0160_2 /ASSEMBLY_ACC=CAM_ASM_000250 /LENGTH=85 /DNA_ID=CAMNT_0025470789 /DNA_START=29 /DNA_END=282 /DNA_ORIENTATION=-
MVFRRIRDAISGPPTLDGPSVLPDYFPVEPRGCESHASRLFACVAGAATEKARDMEKAGLQTSYYGPGVTVTAGDEEAARRVKEA